MSQSLVKNVVHLIFSTKDRAPILSKSIRPQLDAYHAGILTNLKCPALIAGSVEDHVHILFMLSKNVALAEIVEEVKKGSSKWIKNTRPRVQEFSLAGRLRGVLGKRIQCVTRQEIHRQSGRASPQADLSG